MVSTGKIALASFFFVAMYVAMEKTLDFGRYIRDSRRKAGVKQKDIAAAMGIPASYLWQIESGRRPFPLERLGSLPDGIRYPVISTAIGVLHKMLDAKTA